MIVLHKVSACFVTFENTVNTWMMIPFDACA